MVQHKGEDCSTIVFIYLSIANIRCPAFESLMIIYLSPGNWKSRQTLWSWRMMWGTQSFSPWLHYLCYLVLPLVASDSKSNKTLRSTSVAPAITGEKNKTLGEGAIGSSCCPGTGEASVCVVQIPLQGHGDGGDSGVRRKASFVILIHVDPMA